MFLHPAVLKPLSYPDAYKNLVLKENVFAASKSTINDDFYLELRIANLQTLIILDY